MLYDEITHTAIHAVKLDNIATFLGQRITYNCKKEIGTNYYQRILGTRIKHHAGVNNMKVFAITYIYLDVPDFSSIICREGGDYYYPKFHNNHINSFESISLEHIKNYLEVKIDLDINIGDELLYAYHCEENAYIGVKEVIKEDIRNLITKTKIFAATSLIEALEFLEEDYDFIEKEINNALTYAKIYYANYPIHIEIFEDMVNEYLVSFKKITCV